MPDQIIQPQRVLSAENVQQILIGVSFNGDESWFGSVNVLSALRSFVFHAKRLADCRESIRAMLAQLPPPFMSAPGWSFGHACYRADGSRWAKHHETVDGLCALGVGVGAVSFEPSKREQWQSLPGGLPYIVVTL